MVEPTTFTVRVPLRWGDMDAYGHVNNVTMFAILEEARVAVFGRPPSSGEDAPADQPRPAIDLFATFDPGVQALVAENHAKYRAVLSYRGVPARVEVRIEKVTPASLTIGYEVYDEATGTHCVSASTQLAFFDTRAGRLVRLSKAQREALAAYTQNHTTQNHPTLNH